MENWGYVRLRVSRTFQIHLTSPNLSFPYFNFLGGGPVKKNTLYDDNHDYWLSIYHDDQQKWKTVFDDHGFSDDDNKNYYQDNDDEHTQNTTSKAVWDKREWIDMMVSDIMESR